LCSTGIIQIQAKEKQEGGQDAAGAPLVEGKEAEPSSLDILDDEGSDQ